MNGLTIRERTDPATGETIAFEVWIDGAEFPSASFECKPAQDGQARQHAENYRAQLLRRREQVREAIR